MESVPFEHSLKMAMKEIIYPLTRAGANTLEQL